MNANNPLALAETLLDGVVPLDASPQLVPRTTGRSGAQTFEVVVGPRRFILKIDAPGRSQARWSATFDVQRNAADRGITPAVLAWDTSSRAILSEHVEDVSLFAALFDPQRIDGALTGLAESVASLHKLDPRTSPSEVSPLERSRLVLESVPFAVPAFAAGPWRDFRKRGPTEVADALCHLDLNPSNLIYDGRKVWLVDWDTAAAGDRWVDLATLINMLLLPPENVAWMLERYALASGVPHPSAEVLAQARRLVYIGYGCAFLELVNEPPTTAPSGDVSLAACYRALQEGRLDMNSDEGRWQLAAAYFAGYWDVP